jgi:hypothetical protein
MLVAGSVMVVAAHSAASSAVVATAPECWVSTSGAMAIASVEGAAFAFALASAAGPCVVA